MKGKLLHKYILKTAAFLLITMPLWAFGFPPPPSQQQTQTIDGIMGTILRWINDAFLVVMALAFLFFLWGLAKFILKAGEPEERKKGYQVMLWGIIAFVVMSGIWGIVALVERSFGIGGEGTEYLEDRVPEIESGGF